MRRDRSEVEVRISIHLVSLFTKESRRSSRNAFRVHGLRPNRRQPSTTWPGITQGLYTTAHYLRTNRYIRLHKFRATVNSYSHLLGGMWSSAC